MALAITHWEFYKSRRRHLEVEKMLERGTFGKPAGLQEDGSLAWRDLVMAVEGIMADKATRRQRLDMLRQEAGKI